MIIYVIDQSTVCGIYILQTHKQIGILSTMQI